MCQHARDEFRANGNPKGIESFSPALAVRAARASIAYAGWRCEKSSTLKGLNGVATATSAGDATPLGLGIILGDDYPG